MSASVVMLAALLLPLAATPLIVMTGASPNLRESVSIGTGALLFGLLVSLAPGVFEGGRPELDLITVLPGITFGLQLEPLGMLFALTASGLWVATTVYAIGYMRGHGESHQTRFYACFAIAIFATMGAAMARNVLTLFFFYELLTLSTLPLVTHHGDTAARRGGRTYLGILLATSIGLLLPAMIWTQQVAGTLEFVPGGILDNSLGRGPLLVLLALYAFGTGKAALMPFHRWLPAAMVAPTPVSALLHAVAVVKVGVFTVLKVVVYVFGADLITTAHLGQWLTYVAGFTLIAASLVALHQDNLKRRLAYSTISQLSYIVLGAALANASGILGAGLHIVTHAFGKITLFFCAGAIYVAAHKTEVSQLDGLGRRMPWTFAAFTLAAFSIIGLPPFGGAWSKWFLALGTVQSGQDLLLAALMVSSLLNVAYLLPIPARAFFRPLPKDAVAEHGEAPRPCLLALCTTATGCVVLFFAADPLVRLLRPLVSGLGGAP